MFRLWEGGCSLKNNTSHTSLRKFSLKIYQTRNRIMRSIDEDKVVTLYVAFDRALLKVMHIKRNSILIRHYI